MINITKLHNNMDAGSKSVERISDFSNICLDQRCFMLRRGQWWEAPGSFVPTKSYLKYTHKHNKITLIGFVPFPSWVLGTDGVGDRFGCICYMAQSGKEP